MGPNSPCGSAQPTNTSSPSIRKIEGQATPRSSQHHGAPAEKTIVKLSPRDGLSYKHRMFLDLVDYYIFASRYEVTGFRRVVMLTLQHLIRDWQLLPCYAVVKHAVDHLSIDTPLCRFLAACCAYYDATPKKLFRELPSDFLTEVLYLTNKKAHKYEWVEIDEAIDEVGLWCGYHEHESDEQRIECSDWWNQTIEDEQYTFLKAVTDAEGQLGIMKAKSKKIEIKTIRADGKVF